MNTPAKMQCEVSKKHKQENFAKDNRTCQR